MKSKWALFAIVVVVMALLLSYYYYLKLKQPILVANYNVIEEASERKTIDFGLMALDIRKGEDTAAAKEQYGLVPPITIFQVEKVAASGSQILRLQGRFESNKEGCYALDCLWARIVDEDGTILASKNANTMPIKGSFKHTEFLFELRAPKEPGKYSLVLQYHPRVKFAECEIVVE